jgi:hypothetical protein
MKWTWKHNLGFAAIAIGMGFIFGSDENGPYASHCIQKEISASGTNVTYVNGCSAPINVIYCKRYVGTDVVDFFKGERKDTCSEARVEANGIITGGRIAQEGDNLFMTAGSLSEVLTIACRVPYKPELLVGAKHRCIST